MAMALLPGLIYAFTTMGLVVNPDGACIHSADVWGSKLHKPLLPSYRLSLRRAGIELYLHVESCLTSNVTLAMASRLSDAFSRLTAAGK